MEENNQLDLFSLVKWLSLSFVARISLTSQTHSHKKYHVAYTTTIPSRYTVYAREHNSNCDRTGLNRSRSDRCWERIVVGSRVLHVLANTRPLPLFITCGGEHTVTYTSQLIIAKILPTSLSHGNVQHITATTSPKVCSLLVGTHHGCLNNKLITTRNTGHSPTLSTVNARWDARRHVEPMLRSYHFEFCFVYIKYITTLVNMLQKFMLHYVFIQAITYVIITT